MEGGRQLDVREERRDDGDVLIFLRGEFEIGSAPQVREALARAEEFDPRRIVIDLTGVTWIDSTGLAVLVAARKRLSRNGHDLVILLGLETPFGRKLAQTGLDRVLPIVQPDAAGDYGI